MENKSDYIYRVVKNRIINKIYQENKELPPIKQMASEFKVTTATMRKVYKILETEGFITIQPYAGAIVVMNKSKTIKADTDKLIQSIEATMLQAISYGISKQQYIGLVEECLRENIFEENL